MEKQKILKTYLETKRQIGKYFKNRNPLVETSRKSYTIAEVVSAAVLSKSHVILVGSKGSGKTLLAEAIKMGVFGDGGFHIRGDLNLRLKDLFMQINLNASNNEQVFKVCDKINDHFILVDEINRVPGPLQSQFLNLADGYLEIRGKKYYLGNGYLFMAATANPPTNGDYTGVFDEDIALLDRIPLQINVDEVPLRSGDVFSIGMSRIKKESIKKEDLTNDVIESYKALDSTYSKEVLIANSILKEVIYNKFRYAEIEGSRIDKMRYPAWREMIAGQHSRGTSIALCSDISVRKLESVSSITNTLFTLAEIEHEVNKKMGADSEEPSLKDYVEIYMHMLKTSLGYDRRFIPDDLANMLDKNRYEILEDAFTELSESFSPDQLGYCTIVMQEFDDELNKGNIEMAQKMISSDDESMSYIKPIMEAKIDEFEEQEMTDDMLSFLSSSEKE